MPATAHDKAGQVVRAVIDGTAAVGVLPLPREEDREPWWPFLVSKDEGQPRVIARLPFGAPGNARGKAVEALAIGRVAQEETGRDCSLFAIEAAAEVSRSGLRDALAAVSLTPTSVQLWRDRNESARWLHLIEVEGFVRSTDPRFAQLANRLSGFRHLWPLGGYAMPLSSADLEGPSAWEIRAYRDLAEELHRYPDGGQEELRAAIAAQNGLPAEQIVCGAGSDELISLLVRAYAGPGDEVLYSQYGFLMYPIAAKGAGATPVTAPERDYTADVDAMLARVTPCTRAVMLANPNNPTGSLLPAAEVRRLHARLPKDVLLVVDAAYAEYVDRADYEDGAVLVDAGDNV